MKGERPGGLNGRQLATPSLFPAHKRCSYMLSQTFLLNMLRLRTLEGSMLKQIVGAASLRLIIIAILVEATHRE